MNRKISAFSRMNVQKLTLTTALARHEFRGTRPTHKDYSWANINATDDVYGWGGSTLGSETYQENLAKNWQFRAAQLGFQGADPHFAPIHFPNHSAKQNEMLKAGMYAHATTMQAAHGEGPKQHGYVDVAGATYNFDTTGDIVHINIVPQGSSTSERIGKKIMLEGFNIRGSIYPEAETQLADWTVIMVYDTRPTGTLPAITAVLESITSGAQNNYVNSDRFKIWRRWDGMIIGNVAGTPPVFPSATAKSGERFVHYVKMRKKCTWKGAVTTGVIADAAVGAVYLITLGNRAPGVTACGMSAQIRCKFTDIVG